MKPSQVAQALTHLYTARRPAFIWGPPGGGKSAVVAQVASSLKIELRDVRLSLMDPTDIKGFPVIGGTGTKKTLSWAPPDFLPTKGKGILFLDEMNSAPQAVQATSYQLMTDRRIGDYVLPDGWAVFAAGNRASDRAVSHAMPSALANRFVHIDFETDVDDWYAWAMAGNVTDLVRGFIKFRPNLLHNFDPSKNERAFPSPRSWSFVDQLVNSQLSPDTEYELIKGTIGEGTASEFLAFARIARELPTPDEVLLNPDSAPVPESPSGKYAICTALDKKATRNSLGRLITYVERMEPEFQAMFMRSAGIANRDITGCRDYVQWITKNQDLLL